MAPILFKEESEKGYNLEAENDHDQNFPLEKEFDVGYMCDREARCCDEVSYLISIIQMRLDKKKVQNHFNLN